MDEKDCLRVKHLCKACRQSFILGEDKVLYICTKRKEKFCKKQKKEMEKQAYIESEILL